MKKYLVFVGIILVLVIGLLIAYFYPNNQSNLSINDKISLSSNDITKNSNGSIMASNSSQKITANVNQNDVIKGLNDIIKNAPFKIEDTNGFVSSANQEYHQYLLNFKKYLYENIVDNNNLSTEQKANLLWDFFSQTAWVAKNNAFKSIVMDAMQLVDLKPVLEKMSNTYQSLISLGDSSILDRHDIIQLISSTQEKNLDNINVNNLANNTYLNQISNTKNGEEGKGLSNYVIQTLVKNNVNGKDLSTDIDKIIYTAQSNETLSEIYMDSLLISAVRNPQNANLIFNKITSNNLDEMNRKSVNKALAFQLSEDRNFSLSDISPDNFLILKNYINNQPNDVNNNEWQIMVKRINEHKPASTA